MSEDKELTEIKNYFESIRTNLEGLRDAIQRVDRDIEGNQKTSSQIVSQLFDLMSIEREVIKSVVAVSSDNQTLRHTSENINDRVSVLLDKADSQIEYNQMLMAKIWTVISDNREVSSNISKITEKIESILDQVSDSSKKKHLQSLGYFFGGVGIAISSAVALFLSLQDSLLRLLSGGN